MNVIVCYKVVPFEESIAVEKDRTLSFERAELVVGQYDFNAMEAGMQLIEKYGGTVTALTVGASEVENSKARKSVLSRGPGCCFSVNDPSLAGADCVETSQVLAEAVRKIGDFDLVLCGEGSSDLYAQQVGIQLGERLGVPALNGVSTVEFDGEKLKVERSLEDEAETLCISLPAVLSVASGINTTRVPSMRDILAAGKKPVTLWNGSDISLPAAKATETVEVLAPPHNERKQVIFEGDNETTVSEFYRAVSAELK